MQAMHHALATVKDKGVGVARMHVCAGQGWGVCERRRGGGVCILSFRVGKGKQIDMPSPVICFTSGGLGQVPEDRELNKAGLQLIPSSAAWQREAGSWGEQVCSLSAKRGSVAAA